MEKMVKAFINSQNGLAFKLNSSSFEPNKQEKESDEAWAVRYAYYDVKRTCKDIGKHQGEKDAALQDISDAITKYMKDRCPKSQDEFDSWHAETMKIWVDKNKNYDYGTLGRAQKIVNMALKYLYCITESKDHFKFCHMPLDSIMLEWLYREYENDEKNRLTKEKMSSWSLINGTPKENKGNTDNNGKYTYYFYKEKIAGIAGENKTPLQLDFENWQTMQLRLAAEAFLKAFYQESDPEDDKKTKREYSNGLKKKKLKELLDEVNKVTDNAMQTLKGKMNCDKGYTVFLNK